MRSPYNFIVTPLNNKRYDNTKEIGNTEFITSVSEEDHIASNRLATVTVSYTHLTLPTIYSV